MVRPAELTDYNAIVDIRNTFALDITRLDESAYVTSVERNGFLVPTDISRADFSARLANYIVGEVNGEVVGFLRLDDAQEMEPEEIPQWIDPAMEEIYWESPHANIGKVAILSSARGQGIPDAMLAEAERRTLERGISYLFSFIVCCKPPTNYPSMRFHTRNGFKEIAPLAPQDAYGMPDYRASLYGKKLV